MAARNDTGTGAMGGYRYRPGVSGKFHFRIREVHVAAHYVPLISSKRVGAVKLDVMLRAIALPPQHARRRSSGMVLPGMSYENLHDLCRVSSRYRLTTPENEQYDPAVVAMKRNWVGKQLKVLEDLGLVSRELRPAGRPGLIVLKDDGSGDPFDDPDGSSGNSYVTLSGPVLARWLPFWGAPEVAAYLAAMVADRYARFRAERTVQPVPATGGATWFEALHWFADPSGWRPEGHVRTAFSERNLERGLNRLRLDGLIVVTKTVHRPDRPGRRFNTGLRNIYRNRFDELDAAVDATERVSEAEMAAERRKN